MPLTVGVAHESTIIKLVDDAFKAVGLTASDVKSEEWKWLKREIVRTRGRSTERIMKIAKAIGPRGEEARDEFYKDLPRRVYELESPLVWNNIKSKATGVPKYS